jgi:hypothetical protein
MSSSDRKLLGELDRHPDETIDKLIARAKANEDASNASRLRMSVFLDFLNREKERRAKAQGLERDAPGRGR